MSFRRAATRDELWVGEMRGVVVDGVPVLLVSLEDGVHAFEDRCAHKGVPLSWGRLTGTRLVCSVHAWEYDVASGRGLNPDRVCLRAFPVEVAGDEIRVDVSAGPARPAAAAPGDDDVGPVLQAGPLGHAVVEAIRGLNPEARVVDRGAYLRVLCRGRCVVTRAAIEARWGATFRLPGDLELVMSSFKGRFAVSDEEARWELRTHGREARLMATPLKTYSHLAGARRRPTEYELVTTGLHHHVERGLAVDAPAAAWFARHQRGSRWTAADWERFADPRETTYTKYTRLQHAKETYCDGLLARCEDSGYDATLAPEARALLAAALPPLRFALHGFQMIAAYVGHLAPEGRVTIAALLQAADEVRRIQRIAYRMGQLRREEPTFGDGARGAFERDEAWQPLRQVVESLLVTWDWAEAFVALNVCVKPVVDELFMVEAPALAKASGDFLLGQLCASLEEDCQWQRQWTAALARVALARADNRAAAVEWVRAWAPRAERAAAALAPLLARASGRPVDVAAVVRRGTELQRALELSAPEGGP